MNYRIPKDIKIRRRDTRTNIWEDFITTESCVLAEKDIATHLSNRTSELIYFHMPRAAAPYDLINIHKVKLTKE